MQNDSDCSGSQCRRNRKNTVVDDVMMIDVALTAVRVEPWLQKIDERPLKGACEACGR